MPGEKGEHPSARAVGHSEEVTFGQRPGGYEELATGELGQGVQQRQMLCGGIRCEARICSCQFPPEGNHISFLGLW